MARVRDERDAARLPGLEAHGRAGGNVQTKPARGFAIERQRVVDLVEVVVRADLNRTIAGIRDYEHDFRAAGVQLDLAVVDEEFSGNHRGLIEWGCARSRASC